MYKYAISRKSNTLIPAVTNTKASIYPVMNFKSFRKFATRAAARAYKQSLANPRNYVIVNTFNKVVVR